MGPFKDFKMRVNYLSGKLVKVSGSTCTVTDSISLIGLRAIASVSLSTYSLSD